MGYIWSYLLMALCLGLTSAGVMDFPGNRNSFQDNLVSGVKYEKLLTPPTDSGLIIDSNGFPGNSNGPKPANVEDLPFNFEDVLGALSAQNLNSNNFEIIPFTGEDLRNLENSPICRMICKAKVNKPPCKCE